METSDNIRLLFEMLDHPQDYSEQEMLDIINRDDETRDTYRQMVDIKRSSRGRVADQPADVDEAWQRFERCHFSIQRRERSWLKLVATFIGIIVLSGIAVAAVYTMRHTGDNSPKSKTEAPALQRDEAASDTATVIPAIDVVAAEPVVFDNIPLESILGEIASFYGVEVVFQRDAARQLRFHFVWNKEDGLAKVLDDLNHFESVVIGQTGNKLIVQ